MRMPDLGPVFGGVLRSYRLARNLTQEELSLRSDLDRMFVSRMEHGLQRPSLVAVFIIAETLEVPATEIIAEVEAKLKMKSGEG